VVLMLLLPPLPLGPTATAAAVLLGAWAQAQLQMGASRRTCCLSVALAVAASSIRKLFSYAMLLRGVSVHLTRSDQQQQASFVVQVVEALLRSYARLLAEPSGCCSRQAFLYTEHA
jgi:hypothetical protein